MPHFNIYRPAHLEEETNRAWHRCREIQAQAAELLKDPVPDLFLGRKHHERIPLPGEDAK
ncbi:hypothetical protein [Bradyrhizobium sp. CCBAU 51627]|uniref:hypothetical protein n=1 Tax=Bradyrhizobium sp. CCBAU 51627 TaxID=1325088 RepID=UPI0023055546|nr:hypothetical protein [Bradyrhizobium sp. CCBAU 51627]